MNLLRDDIKSLDRAFSRDGGTTKLDYPFYVLEYLINNSSKENKIKLSKLTEALKSKGISLTEKSVGYYISFLYSLGFRIKFDEYKRGKNKYRTNYYFDHELDKGQIQYLTDSVLSSKTISKNDAKHIIERLNLLVSKEDRYYANNIKNESSSFYHSKDVLVNVVILSRAIKNKFQVNFKRGRYIIEDNSIIMRYAHKELANPYSLIIYNDRYYLECNIERYDDIEYIPVDKITDIKILDSFITKKSKINPFAEDSDEFSFTHPYMLPGKPENIELKIRSSVLDDIIMTFGIKNIKLIEDEGHFSGLVSIKCNEADMYRFALMHGAEVTVISPAKLRADLQMTASKMMGAYSRTRDDAINIVLRRAEKERSLISSNIPLENNEEIKKLENLRLVDLSRSYIRDYSFLKNSPNLLRLMLERERVDDFKVFENHNRLLNISMIDTNIKNLDFITNTDNLRFIKIVSKDYVDISKIYNMKNLRFLFLYIKNYKDVDVEKIKDNNKDIRIRTGDYYEYMKKDERNIIFRSNNFKK